MRGGTSLDCICSSIPNTIQQLIVRMEEPSIVSQILCRGRRRKLNRNLCDLDITSCVVDQTQVSESSSFMLTVYRHNAGALRIEPQSFIHARILSGIASDTRDPL